MKKLLGKTDICKQFQSMNASLPYMYGLPKTHKVGSPLRPIISNVGSVTYKLSKWLANHLAPAVGASSDSYIRNSQDFCEKVKDLTIPAGSRLVSFDVESLFTMVPVDETIKYLEEIMPSLNLDIPVTNKKFVDLIRLVLDDNVFVANGAFYRQKAGLAMGNPLSPILANLFMEYFESKLLKDIAPPNLVWLRYVDDVFSIWPADRDFDIFFTRLNTLHPCINFKVEWEKDDQIPFLDVLVHKGPSGLHFSVYRKPTNSNAYIHYYSFHDKRTKKAVISGIFLRAYRICNTETLGEEISTIQRIFAELRYPEWFTHDAHMAARKTFFATSREKRETPKKCLVLPYNEGLTGFKKVCHEEGVGVAFTYPNTISKTLIKTNPKVNTT